MSLRNGENRDGALTQYFRDRSCVLLVSRAPLLLAATSTSGNPSRAMAAPPWPSLYDPLLEFRNFRGRDPIQPGASYLHNATDVFRFTFYWTLVLHAPIFVLSGALAAFNTLHPPSRPPAPTYPIVPLTAIRSPLPPTPASRSSPRTRLLRPGAGGDAPRRAVPKNVRRSRATVALLVLLAFGAAAVASSLLQSLVVGYVLAGLYRAAKYNMSTCVIHSSSVTFGLNEGCTDGSR